MNTKPSMSAIAIATGVIIVAATLTTSVVQSTQAFVIPGVGGIQERSKAPAAISGDNVYVAWSTNNTANNNEEIMFRASTDGGISFGEKINLSNTTEADSSRAEIDSDVDSVVVTWWESNQTSDAPVMRVSTDNGATFGPLLTLATNGTIGQAEGTEEGE